MRIDNLVDVAAFAPEPPKTAKAAEAVRDFEAILIGQMLKTARESGTGSWLASEQDAASSPAVEFAEQQLAQAVAAGGGLGLAKLLAAPLAASDHQE